jgi:hypothetical protein
VNGSKHLLPSGAIYLAYKSSRYKALAVTMIAVDEIAEPQFPLSRADLIVFTLPLSAKLMPSV